MRKLLTVLLAVAAIGACNASTDVLSSDDRTSAAGNYGLVSVNDTLLPYPLLAGTGHVLELTADTVFMNVNGAFLDITRYRDTNLGVITPLSDSLGGAWRLNGSTVTFNGVNGSQFTATLSGRQMRINGSGLVTVYSK
jgi:hypothetical protein